MGKFLVLALATGLLGGCAMANSPVFGPIFTSGVKGPVSMGDPAAGHSKTGRATATAIFGIGMGDASIQAAMTQGNITKVHHVDSETFNALAVYTTFTTIVHGE